MMGKRAAQELARKQTLTWGDLYSLVSAPCDRSATCPINAQLTMGYCQDLYGEITGKRPSAEVPRVWRSDVYARDPNAMKPSGDFLTVQSILRIFGPPTTRRVSPATRAHWLPPGECAFCDSHHLDPMMPYHDASSRCESGKHPHCTCDTCY
jgi:hypothetical protein